MLREKLESMLIEDMELIESIISEVYCLNGELENLVFYSTDEIDDILHGYRPSQIADMMFYGNYNPCHVVFRFDGYGNLESLSQWDLEDEYKMYIDEIVEALLRNKDDIYLPREIELVLATWNFDEDEEEDI